MVRQNKFVRPSMGFPMRFYFVRQRGNEIIAVVIVIHEAKFWEPTARGEILSDSIKCGASCRRAVLRVKR